MKKLFAPVKDLVLELDPSGDVTQWFGENHELYFTNFGLQGHNGIDIVRPWGSPLLAIEDAEVLEVKYDAGGFGKHVRILGKNKNVNGYYNEWTYGHCSSINVRVGDKVVAGQEIAKMGNTGFVVTNKTPYWATNPYGGTHVHFGLRQIVKPASGGWTYPESRVRVDVIDYNNGYKGAIDPVPFIKALALTEKVPSAVPVAKQVESLQLQVIEALKSLYAVLTKK